MGSLPLIKMALSWKRIRQQKDFCNPGTLKKAINREDNVNVPLGFMNLFDESESFDKEQVGEITLQGRDWGIDCQSVIYKCRQYSREQ